MTNIERFKRMFNCDTVRIWNGGGKKFLILGWNRNTRDNPNGQWFKNGEPIHFDYLDEKCVASGSNLRLLLQSAREYKRLLSVSMEDYLREVCNGN